MSTFTKSSDHADDSFVQRDSVDDSVVRLAAASTSQTDFLNRMAAHWAAVFSADVVAVTHPSWNTPMLWVSDETIANRLDAKFANGLLNSSTSAAIACDIPLRPPSVSPSTESQPAVPGNRARGLHIRLTDQNVSCAVLLVYGDRALPDASAQVRDLRRLAEYATPCRTALLGLNDTGEQKEMPGMIETTDRRRSLRHFHDCLDVTRTAYRIANEARRVLSFDRVSVLLVRQGRLRVESVSGVAVVDRRANSVAAAEAFAQRTLVLGRPITLPSSDPLPPQIADPLDRYLDETDITAVVVLPLYRPSDRLETSDTEDQTSDAEPIAVLLLESFSGSDAIEITPAMKEVAAEATVALANSLEHQRIFGLRALKTMGDWFGGRRLPYTLLGLICIAASLAAAMIIQVDHKIIATGFAEPSVQQNVFARSDGIVKEILVRDGQRVTAGEVLMRLENADLETSAETLSGEIQTALQRSASVGSLLLDPATDEIQSGRLAIEQRQLQSELANLRIQLELVRRQILELKITAPIDGTIAGWQLKRKLSDRPVGRGNHLLSIVRTDGPWHLRLEIPDQDAAEVFRARAAEGELKVEFAAASHPESTFAATLDSIATAARRNDQGVTVIDAEATIDSADQDGRRFGLEQFASADAHTGVETTAKISCGRRSILSSWFGDVADFVNRNILFYLR